ncbi:glycosyltransferase family 4 protein [Paenibacillus xylaniclasticus]|uniref:glycosyltransferase family 4 protein n=1 Tax=Paenibacillus xylaniclasticus TaxID=588083 RepID=UPI000FD70C2C|nr:MULTISPECIES: glycosyltransferase family 4 protein [Paenibacillus]
MGYLCKCIEEFYDDVKIEILVHNYNNIDIHAPNYPTIEMLNERFSLQLNKTSILKLDLPKANSLKEHYRNKRIIEKMTESYDLFINFMFLSKHEGRARKNIYSCMFPPTHYQFPDSLFRQLAGKWMDRKFVKSYDYFITNSYYTNHWHEHFWHTGAKNKVIYPPVFSEQTVLQRVGESTTRKNMILSVGRFFVGAHNKKQDALVDMFLRNCSKWPGWEFHLAGAVSTTDIDVEYVNQIKKRIEGSPVYLHLNCPFSELEQLYKEAKIFWHATGYGENDNEFPEKMEHFGITTVEAMSYGVVPVVINKGGQTEIIQQSETGLLWNTEEELVAHTEMLMAEEAERVRQAQRCYDSANLFSIEKFYEKSREILHAVNL